MPVRELASECKPEEKPMNNMHYVGLDIHKKTISYCVRQSGGTILQENTMAAIRPALDT
jgi:transposase